MDNSRNKLPLNQIDLSELKGVLVELLYESDVKMKHPLEWIPELVKIIIVSFYFFVKR